jgi:hypothetical protein
VLRLYRAWCEWDRIFKECDTWAMTYGEERHPREAAMVSRMVQVSGEEMREAIAVLVEMEAASVSVSGAVDGLVGENLGHLDAHEDRAATPGVTRLARVLDERG